MNPFTVRRAGVVLAVAIAIVPWIAVSRTGDARVTLPSIPRGSPAIESLASVVGVASDRPAISPHAKRLDGHRLVATLASEGGVHPTSSFIWDGMHSGGLGVTAPLALNLAERGPPHLLGT